MKDYEDLGGFTVIQWKVLRETTKSQAAYSDEWETAINWYDTRLKRRYFDPMKSIESHSQGEGFSLATIHCALIEHFASMVSGKIFNSRLKKRSPNFEYNLSGPHFKDFLRSYSPFTEYFTSQQGNPAEFSVGDFYANVRCALLHNACTKNNWRINTMRCGYANPQGKILVKDPSGIKRLFRDVLTTELELFMQHYKRKLQGNHIARMYFARCIDDLCDLPKDPNGYPWWVDNI